MRTAAFLLTLSTALSLPLGSVAHADAFHATRSASLVERAHDIAVTLHRDHAELRVRRTVFNGADLSDQATFFIDLPEGAVATGLRTLAITDGKPVWYAGELMEAEAAAKKYRELTGVGGYYPKDPALLSWRDESLLALQVFPCLGHQEKTVEYTLTMPTQWSEGRSVLRLPVLGTDEVAPKVVVSSALGPVLIDGEAGASTDLSKERVLSVEPRAQAVLSASLAHVAVDDEQNLEAYRVSAGKKVSTLPEKARIVVLLDRSWSLSADQIEASRVAAKGALAHFAAGDDVRVHVASFDRTVTPLTSGFVTLAVANDSLTDDVIAQGNGSELSVALQHARDLLATAPVDAARRVVVFTDLATRDALTPDVAAASVPKGGVLHLVSLDAYDRDLEPDETDPWAALPRGTGGLLFAGGTSTDADAEVAKARFEELVRPTRIHKLALKSGETVLETSTTVLDEGESIEWREISKTSLDRLSVSGELWSTPITREVRPDASFGRLEAALAFGNGLYSSLDDDGMMKLAMHGRAVSPVTSYLAIEPGVRPSTEGLDEGGRGMGIGLGSIGTTSTCYGGGSAFDALAELRKLVDPILAKCGAPTASVEVETTWREIVDVTVKLEGDGAAVATARDCVDRAVWALELPADRWSRHATLRVDPAS